LGKNERTPELHFYEWRIGAWAMSETRGRLLAAGRGIYRELLDCCYAQGKFPADNDWICRQCACTPEELSVAWLIIKKHFKKTKNRKYWMYQIATSTRNSYFIYINEQRRKRKIGIDKANNEKQLSRFGRTIVEPRRETELINGSTKEKEKEKEKESGCPQVDLAEWCETRYSRHPKKGNKFIAFGYLQELHEISDPEWRANFERVHELWIASEAWRWKGGAGAPELSKWILDEGWKYPPGASDEPEEEKPYRPLM
jgi:hypothetical protein